MPPYGALEVVAVNMLRDAPHSSCRHRIGELPLGALWSVVDDHASRFKRLAQGICLGKITLLAGLVALGHQRLDPVCSGSR